LTLKNLREKYHEIYLLHRNIDNLIHNDNFEIVWKDCSEEELIWLEHMISRNNLSGLKTFTTEKLLSQSVAFKKMSIRKLRNIGQYLKIENYQYITKLTLIEEIENEIERIKKDSKRKSVYA
jgi:hypothetical protein